MKIVRPLQVGFQHRVLEQHGAFHLVLSLSMYLDLATGGARLDILALEEMFACMGEHPQPDPGMPKPRGEFLVSGSFHAPGGTPVPAGEVRVRVADHEKRLVVFGPRSWQRGAPGPPAPVTEVPLDCAHALGGPEDGANPLGMGIDDGRLPQVEIPARLITSPRDRPEPATLGPLPIQSTLRSRLYGTYDENYLYRFFPGFPDDHDWHAHLAAPSDQWIQGFFNGTESFALHHLHPDRASIQGRLPGLRPRCFLLQGSGQGPAGFIEVPLRADTLWFFPEAMLAQLIFRGVLRVEDDEASSVEAVLCAYEDSQGPSRPDSHYRQALESRLQDDDGLRMMLTTHDLVPEEHRSAMEILFDQKADSRPSPLTDNMEAMEARIVKDVESRVEKEAGRVETMLEEMGPPEEFRDRVDKAMDSAGLDISGLIRPSTGQGATDPEVRELMERMEAIQPGITSGRDLDMRGFSFARIEEIMALVSGYAERKKEQAMDQVRQETARQQDILDQGMTALREQAKAGGAQVEAGLSETRKHLDNLMDGREEHEPAPLPRLDVEAVQGQLLQAKLDPRLMEAMDQVRTMRETGADPADIQRMEEALEHSAALVRDLNDPQGEMARLLEDAARDFKEIYLQTAHFLPAGLPPHAQTPQERGEALRDLLERGGSPAGQDWACVDLSGWDLAGVDFSEALLEQVDFRGANLAGARFSRAILARARLEEANLHGADFREANAGAVQARGARCHGADFRGARLSRGDFQEADLGRARFDNAEFLETRLQGTCLREASLPGMIFLEIELDGTDFTGALLDQAVFLLCRLDGCRFQRARMERVSFVDCRMKDLDFNEALLERGCFVASREETAQAPGMRFDAASLGQANFQDMVLDRASFAGALLDNALFNGASLRQAVFTGATARRAQFSKTCLRHARLDGLNLDQGSLARSDLVQASFRRANLRGVDVLRAVITATDFSGANLDDTLIRNWRP